MQDNLARKMNQFSKNVKYLRIFKFKQDEELFEPEADSQFQQFGKLTRVEGAKQRVDSRDYAVVSFWQRNEYGEQQVHVPYFLSMPLSRVVNKESDLREVLFTADNFDLVFLFNRAVEGSPQLSLSVLGQPESHSNAVGQRAASQRSSRGQKALIQDILKGVHAFDIELDSFLERQVLAYMENYAHAHAIPRDVFPMRAPTMIKLDQQVVLVLGKTTRTGRYPMSLCFVNVIEDLSAFQRAVVATSDDDPTVGATGLPAIGDILYEVPGAEMYLGLDAGAQHVYYLTNKKYSDPGEEDRPAPAEARFSSPALVRKISLGQLRQLQPLMQQLRSQDRSHAGSDSVASNLSSKDV